ncbi:MAG: ribonuclease Z [Myxococcota bacterium]
MSARELVVLGTASQVPTRYRNHNGYLLLWDGQGFLFDPGEGTQRQMVTFGVSATQITAICVSHFHGDHCLGLPGVIQRISLDRVPHRVPVYYPASGQKYLDRLRHASIFDDQSDIEPRPLRTPGVQSDGNPAITALPLQHTAESWGYRIQEPDRVHCLPERLRAAGVQGRAVGELVRTGSVAVDGRLVRLEEVSERKKGGSVAFVMDTRRCDAAVALAEGVDLLIAESTYLASEQREARERGHMTAGDAARVAVEAGAKKLVLTHFSQRHPSTRPFLDEAGAIHGDVVAAVDGTRVDLRQIARPVGDHPV